MVHGLRGLSGDRSPGSSLFLLPEACTLLEPGSDEHPRPWFPPSFIAGNDFSPVGWFQCLTLLLKPFSRSALDGSFLPWLLPPQTSSAVFELHAKGLTKCAIGGLLQNAGYLPISSGTGGR